MPGLASSIQKLLQLSAPLPASITDDLRVGNRTLLRADEDFKSIAHDLRVWTLYETIDSRLSGGEGVTGPSGSRPNNDNKDGVYFTAPMTSVRSAILGMRQERIFPLQSDHANVASFGRHNAHTLRLFLRQLAVLISRADASVRATREDGEDGGGAGARWTLNLEQRVSVEVHGFFEDTMGEAGMEETVTRAWSTRLPLSEFLRKGPEECLGERLSEVEGVPDESQFLRSRGRTMSMTEAENDRVRREASTREGLGIKNQLLQKGTPPLSPLIRPLDTSPRSNPEVVASSQHIQRVRRISSPGPSATTRRVPTPSRHSTPMRRPSPLVRAQFDQDLVIDRLSPPTRPQSIISMGRSVSDQFEFRDFPPFSQQRSRSTVAVVEDDDSIETSPALPEPVLPIPKLAKPAAFSRPEASQRKFVWVHLPYNNPAWVKVSSSLDTRIRAN